MHRQEVGAGASADVSLRRRRSRSSTRISTWILCVFFSAALSSPRVLAAAPPYTAEQLEAMDDDALERLCLDRGFEMVRDDVDEITGEVYRLQHSDFVKAASQCLAIESEMNELLDENPELADELEDEIKRLAKEADRLEDIKNERTAEVKRLQNELKQKQANDTEAQVGSSEGFSNPVENLTFDTTRIQTKKSAKRKSDMTLKALVVEIVRTILKQVETDMRRVFHLFFPSVNPVWSAGDIAWKHLRSMFQVAKAKRKAASKSTSSKPEKEAETCSIDS